MNDTSPQGLRRARKRGAWADIFPRCTKHHGLIFQQKNGRPHRPQTCDCSDLSGVSAAKNALSGLLIRTEKTLNIKDLESIFCLSGVSGLFLGRKGKDTARPRKKRPHFLHRSNATAGRLLRSIPPAKLENLTMPMNRAQAMIYLRRHQPRSRWIEQPLTEQAAQDSLRQAAERGANADALMLRAAALSAGLKGTALPLHVLCGLPPRRTGGVGKG
jgi:hypothetical protein